jgi:hypothetical protein
VTCADLFAGDLIGRVLPVERPNVSRVGPRWVDRTVGKQHLSGLTSQTRSRRVARLRPRTGQKRLCGARCLDMPRVLELAKWMVLVGCLVVALTALGTNAADAHVKWFVDCNVSDAPLPIQVVFTTTFFLFLTAFLAVFYIACEAEQTALGAVISRILNRWTGSLHRRSDDLLRAAAAISFVLLWADGGLILTPELKASHAWISMIQLLIPIYLFGRATLPAAGAGIILLFGYGAASYGLFHMLDYPVFLGLGVFFALSVSRNPKLVAFRFLCLRWAVALSLLWPAMEKFVYPGWVAPIAIMHPEITLGFDVATVVTGAGVVEFGLAFALFWTPLVRRLAALVLMGLLVAATFDFGKVDAIGHSMIVIILLVVFANPGGKPEYSRPVLAPVVAAAALPAAIFLYTGAHTLAYGSKPAALVPLVSGMLLLAFIFVALQGFFARALLRTTVRRLQGLIGSEANNARSESRPRPSHAHTSGVGTFRPKTPPPAIVPAPAQYGAFVSTPLSSKLVRDRLPYRPSRSVGIRMQTGRSPTSMSSRIPTSRFR